MDDTASLPSAYDVFLVHSGAQKNVQASGMKCAFQRRMGKNTKIFLDKDMENGGGAPVQQMREALSTTRHVVAVISEEFLDTTRSRHPSDELIFAFDRMSWMRKHYPTWRSLWIVFYDTGIEQYKQARRHNPRLPADLLKETVVHFFSERTGGKYGDWETLCDTLCDEIVRHDENAAVGQWHKFLEAHAAFLSFPKPDSLYESKKVPYETTRHDTSNGESGKRARLAGTEKKKPETVEFADRVYAGEDRFEMELFQAEFFRDLAEEETKIEKVFLKFSMDVQADVQCPNLDVVVEDYAPYGWGDPSKPQRGQRFSPTRGMNNVSFLFKAMAETTTITRMVLRLVGAEMKSTKCSISDMKLRVYVRDQ